MAQTNFNVGAIANDGTGDALRDAFIAQQAMNTDLYTNKVDKVVGKDLSENDFTDALKDKLDNLNANAEENIQADWLQDDDTQDDYIKNKPEQLFASVGHFHYNDLATQTTPLVVLPSVPKKLTNDALGDFTTSEFAPYGVSSVWETSTNSLTFSPLDLGDEGRIRFDLLLTSTSPSQTFALYVKFGVGSASEYDMLVSKWVEKDAVTDGQIIRELSFSIDNEDWLFNVADIYILSDDDASVKVNGWYIPIIRKSINVVSIEGDFLSNDISTYTPATTPLAGTELALIDDGTGFKKVAVSEFVGDLQSVTDNGNSTTNDITTGKITTPMVQMPEGSFSVQIYPVELTANRKLEAPDKNGIIATIADVNLKLDKDFSTLPNATLPLDFTETIAVRQTGTTKQVEISELNKSFVFTIELIDYLTVDFYAPAKLKINSIEKITSTPSITILVSDDPYTLGNLINTGRKITINSDSVGVVNLTGNYE